MKKYGYDQRSGAMFSWEFDFQYEGRPESVPDRSGVIISDDQIEDEMVGCAFMSGWTGDFILLHSDGKDHHYYLFGTDLRVGMWKGKEIDTGDLKKMTSRMPICICGKIVQSSEQMAKVCASFPNSRMYACPLVEELAAFGALARFVGKRPYRPYQVLFSGENNEPLNAEFREFDPSLDGDSMGRMAEIVMSGLPVVNEMKRNVIGVSSFYGKTLHKDWKPGCRMIVRVAEVDKYFPETPISSKNYVATSVPVQMEVSETLHWESGYNEKFSDVFVATDYMPGVSTFMRFYKTFSGRGFVFVSDQEEVIHGPIVPVFRSDKAYRVPRDKYEQSHGFLRSVCNAP